MTLDTYVYIGYSVVTMKNETGITTLTTRTAALIDDESGMTKQELEDTLTLWRHRIADMPVNFDHGHFSVNAHDLAHIVVGTLGLNARELLVECYRVQRNKSAKVTEPTMLRAIQNVTDRMNGI